MYSVEINLSDEDDFYEDFHHETNIYLYPASEPPPPPMIESCNSTGVVQDVFELGETVYVTGGGFSPATSYPFFIVPDQEVWVDGMSIPEPIIGPEPTIVSNQVGEIDPSDMWHSPHVVGSYDMIVDVNRNGQYDSSVDALDDGDVEVTAGLSIVPEFSTLLPFFILLLLLSTILLRKKII